MCSRSTTLTGLALMAALVMVTPARATTQWSAPVRLSAPNARAWFPGIAADAGGRVHAFWAYSLETPLGYDSVVYCPVTPSGCAERIDVQVRQAGGGYYVTRPSPVVSPNGLMHVLWSRKGTICHSAVPVQGPYMQTRWTRLLKMGDPASYSTLAIAPDGVLHATWAQGVFPGRDQPCNGCADVFYSRSADDGTSWSIPRNLTQTPYGSLKPQIAFGANGSVYVAWEEGIDHYAGKGQLIGSMLTMSPDGGGTWRRPVALVAPGYKPHSIAIGVDQHDQVVAVWQEAQGRNIFWQISSDHGASWSTPTRFEGLITRSIWNQLDTYQMAPDSARHLHVVLSGRLEAEENLTPTSNHVFHVEWDGRAWSEPTSLFTTAGVPEWTRIAINGGNQLHAIWFERPAGFEWNTKEGIYAVWYGHGTSGAPTIAPIPWPALEHQWLTASQWFRLAQAIVAVAIVATVIGASRRRGW